MQEHARHQCEYDGKPDGCFLWEGGGAEDHGWNRTVLNGKELSRHLSQIALIDKHDKTHGDERHRHQGGQSGRIIVMEWDHEDSRL